MRLYLPCILLLFMTACAGSSHLSRSGKSLEIANGFQVRTLRPSQSFFLRWHYNGVQQEPVRYTSRNRGSVVPTTVRLTDVRDTSLVVASSFWYDDASTPFGTAPGYQISDNDYALVIPLGSITEIYLPRDGHVPDTKTGDREAYQGNLVQDILVGALGGALIAAGGRAAADVSRNEAVYSRTPPTGLIFIGAAIGALAYPIYNALSQPRKIDYQENVTRLEDMQKFEIGPEGWKLRVVSE